MKALALASCVVSVLLLTSAHAQYLAPRQYMRRLAPQQPAPNPPPPQTPAVPPGPQFTPTPPATLPGGVTNSAKASAEKAAALKRLIEFQKKRAEGGSASAQYDLGMRYLNGDGVEKNLEEARKWLAAAARQDHVWAQKKLKELGEPATPEKPAAKDAPASAESPAPTDSPPPNTPER